MNVHSPLDPACSAEALVDLIGREAWRARMAELKRGCRPSYAGRALAQRHAIELTIDRLRRPGRNSPRTEIETEVLSLAADLVALGRITSGSRLTMALDQAVSGCGTLIPLFHLLRTAAIQRRNGFEGRVCRTGGGCGLRPAALAGRG